MQVVIEITNTTPKEQSATLYIYDEIDSDTLTVPSFELDSTEE